MTTTTSRTGRAVDTFEETVIAVLLGLILIVNSVSITLRVWLRSRKKW